VGVIAVLTLALKQMLRSYGLKVCIIAALMLSILIEVAGNRVPNPIMIGIVVPASASSLIIDFKTHYSMLRVLYMVGATPRQIKTYMLIPSILLSIIYGMPYITINTFYAALAFLLSMISSTIIMSLALHITKMRSSAIMM